MTFLDKQAQKSMHGPNGRGALTRLAMNRGIVIAVDPNLTTRLR
jgi:hypothetical protein